MPRARRRAFRHVPAVDAGQRAGDGHRLVVRVLGLHGGPDRSRPHSPLVIQTAAEAAMSRSSGQSSASNRSWSTSSAGRPSITPTRIQWVSSVLDRLVKDGIEPDASLEQAVATVAYIYATIGGMVESSD